MVIKQLKSIKAEGSNDVYVIPTDGSGGLQLLASGTLEEVTPRIIIDNLDNLTEVEFAIEPVITEGNGSSKDYCTIRLNGDTTDDGFMTFSMTKRMFIIIKKYGDIWRVSDDTNTGYVRKKLNQSGAITSISFGGLDGGSFGAGTKYALLGK